MKLRIDHEIENGYLKIGSWGTFSQIPAVNCERVAGFKARKLFSIHINTVI